MKTRIGLQTFITLLKLQNNPASPFVCSMKSQKFTNLVQDEPESSRARSHDLWIPYLASDIVIHWLVVWVLTLKVNRLWLNIIKQSVNHQTFLKSTFNANELQRSVLTKNATKRFDWGMACFSKWNNSKNVCLLLSQNRVFKERFLCD